MLQRQQHSGRDDVVGVLERNGFGLELGWRVGLRTCCAGWQPALPGGVVRTSAAKVALADVLGGRRAEARSLHGQLGLLEEEG